MMVATQLLIPEEQRRRHPRCELEQGHRQHRFPSVLLPRPEPEGMVLPLQQDQSPEVRERLLHHEGSVPF